MTYDVVIAGAGVGGAYLAKLAAQKGLKVALVETAAKDKIGHDWSDSIERAQIEKAVDHGALGDMSFAVAGFIARAPDGTGGIEFDSYPFLIVDRRKLASRLIEDAAAAGAQIIRAKVLFPLFDEHQVFGIGVESGGKVEKIIGRITVDATGISSTLRCALPSEWSIDTARFADADCAHAYREIRRMDPNAEWPPRRVLIYRYGRYRGYSWINRESDDAIDVGMGMPATNPLSTLKELVACDAESIAGVKRERIRGGGGKLPVRRPIPSFVANGFVAIGDSASQAHPLLGCNVGNILLACELAVEAVQHAVSHKRFGADALWSYNAGFMRSRGAVLASLDAMRIALQDISEEEIGWLMKRGVLGKPALWRSLAILPPKLELSELVKALLCSLSRTRLMVKLSQASWAARDAFEHYRRYPASYDPEEFASWAHREKRLFESISRIANR